MLPFLVKNLNHLPRQAMAGRRRTSGEREGGLGLCFELWLCLLHSWVQPHSWMQPHRWMLSPCWHPPKLVGDTARTEPHPRELLGLCWPVEPRSSQSAQQNFPYPASSWKEAARNFQNGVCFLALP